MRRTCDAKARLIVAGSAVFIPYSLSRGRRKCARARELLLLLLLPIYLLATVKCTAIPEICWFGGVFCHGFSWASSGASEFRGCGGSVGSLEMRCIACVTRGELEINHAMVRQLAFLSCTLGAMFEKCQFNLKDSSRILRTSCDENASVKGSASFDKIDFTKCHNAILQKRR